MRAAIAILITVILTGLLVWWRPSGFYLWFKAFHIIAIIAWMAGMLYLPRLFVYHCSAPWDRHSPKPSRSWSAASFR